jgi:signal transduction histidine kinase
MVNNYSKRFVAWATALWEKFASKLLPLGVGLANGFFAVRERIANKLLKHIFAREILQSQKRFISDVAHELRTPLAVIKTSAEVALIDPTLDKDARASFEEIIGELERVSEILNNLLSLNSLSRPEQMLFKNLDVAAVAEVVVARLRPLARERNLRIRLRVRTGSIAWANAAACEQILTNVLKNALLYTPKGGDPVILTVAPELPKSATEEPWIQMTVADQGVGIAPKDLDHIFEPFYRADLSRTKLNTKTGSGLGLVIVGELVRAQNGTIGVESKRSKGTTVTVRLPTGGSLRTHEPIQSMRSDIRLGNSSAIQAHTGTLGLSKRR